MNHVIRLVSLSLVLGFVAGCADASDDPDSASSIAAVTLSVTDANAILALVNYPGTDEAVLDTAVGLDSRAAQGIVAARAGADGVEPSDDDQPFATIAQLDAIPYVGDAAFRRLQSYALANPPPAAEDVEGVHFAGWQTEAVVFGINSSDPAALDALLDSRAVTGLVAARPFADVAAIGRVAYVGSSALTHLAAQATSWWSAMHGHPTDLAGRFDGAIFDEATAVIALDIANRATASQLTAHGVTSAAASHIIAARPFTTVAQVSEVSGVGQATMNAVQAYASSGAWVTPPVATCVQTFDDAVQPHLADLLFMSESDRPFDLVSYPGAGSAAPTAESVLALVSAPAGSTAELRNEADYFVAFEPEGSTADPNAAAAVEAAFAAQLTDVVYVAVHAPADSVDRALVDVYLVGRTSCGDLVGLHAIAVET